MHSYGTILVRGTNVGNLMSHHDSHRRLDTYCKVNGKYHLQHTVQSTHKGFTRTLAGNIHSHYSYAYFVCKLSQCNFFSETCLNLFNPCQENGKKGSTGQ